jgi:hypothetical protein
MWRVRLHGANMLGDDCIFLLVLKTAASYEKRSIEFVLIVVVCCAVAVLGER